MPNALTPAFGASGFSATQTVSVNFGTNANRALLGVVFFDNNVAPASTVSSVVIDPAGANLACTLGARRAGSTALGVQGYFYAFWASGASVPTGTKDVVATSVSPDGKPRVWCLPLDDVSAISGEAVATGLSLAPSVALSSATGQTVYAMMAISGMLDSQTLTPGTGTTSIARVLEATAGGLAGGIWQEAGAASVTIDGTYTGATAQWAMTAWSVTGASGTAPSITTQPSNQTVTAPATATFTVAATGTGTLTYQWQRNPLGGGSFTNISGATSSSYTTPATSVTGGSANNSDQYRCVVTGDTSPPATSNAATLTVNAGGSAPAITTQPSNQTVTAPATATFTAAASGSPTPTVQWYRNGAEISGATSASYTTPATTVTGGTANNGDVYAAVFTNASGFVQTVNATLTVSAAGSFSASTDIIAVAGVALASTAVFWTWLPSGRAGAVGTVVNGTGTTNGSGILSVTHSVAGDGLLLVSTRPGPAVGNDRLWAQFLTLA